MGPTPACAHLDFLVIGAMKAGTTSVFEFLAAQPGVHAPRNKEPHYFTRGYRMPVSYYRWLFHGRSPGQITGEASPTYSNLRRYPECVERIARDAPSVRIVYLVRDPLERIVSHFRHHQLLGSGAGTIEEALAVPDLWNRSRYLETIEAYLTRFPTDQLLVLDFDALRADGAGLVTLLRFLGLPAGDDPAVLPQSNITDRRTAVPGPVGRLARTPVGAMVRDLVPAAALQRVKGTVARPVGDEPAPTTDAVRRCNPELAARLEADYETVRRRYVS